MREIPLTQGKTAIVDDDDYEWLMAMGKWGYEKGPRTGYARRADRVGKNRHKVWMHREIMRAPRGIQVDHIDGDGCNNQRANLRLASGQQNCRNRKPLLDATSPYKGVSYKQDSDTYAVRIRLEKGSEWLGCHADEHLAARIYDCAAVKHYGEYAQINFPGEPMLSDAEFARLTERKARASSYRGISWHSERERWRVVIHVEGRRYHIGYFRQEIDAALAYNEAAIKYHGDNAKLNTIQEQS